MNSSGDEGREELERQIAAVAAELNRREMRLASVEAELAALKGRLGGVSFRRGYLRGDSALLACAGAHRRSLEKMLASRERESREIFEYVQRARERLKLLREELQAVASAPVD